MVRVPSAGGTAQQSHAEGLAMNETVSPVAMKRLMLLWSKPARRGILPRSCHEEKADTMATTPPYLASTIHRTLRALRY